MRFDQAQASDPHRRRPAAGPGHRTTSKEESNQGGHGDQQPGRRIEAPHLPEDHPARTRRTPATPPAPGPAPGEAPRAEIGTTWRTAGPAPDGTTRAADHPAALLFANDQHDQGDDHPDGHHYPGGDPHGRQAAGPRRRRPAAGPGTAQRTRPGHRATGKEEKTRAGTAATTTTATTETRNPDTGSRPGRSCCSPGKQQDRHQENTGNASGDPEMPDNR